MDPVSAEFAGTGINITSSPVVIACSVPLFSLTPAASDYLSNGGIPREVAVQFSASHAGRITALQYYFPPGETVGSHTARLWTDTGTLLASTSISPPPFGSAGPRTGSLSSPIAIQAGVRYRVSITTLSVRSETLCSKSASKSLYLPITNGPVTAHQSFWINNPGASQIFPTTSSCSNLWVGVIFDKT